jgi:hypothetical protein
MFHVLVTLLQYFVVSREIVDQVFDEVQFMAVKR